MTRSCEWKSTPLWPRVLKAKVASIPFSLEAKTAFSRLPLSQVNGYYGPGYWHSVPAELSGFCTSTAYGLFKPLDIQISVHVKLTYSGSGQTNTGKLDRGQITSYLLVEDYCT